MESLYAIACAVLTALLFLAAVAIWLCREELNDMAHLVDLWKDAYQNEATRHDATRELLVKAQRGGWVS